MKSLRMTVVMLAAILGLAVQAEETVMPRVTVTSQPAGATVIVDGKDRGTTPITLFDLAPGRHHLKYRLAGYVERDRIINTSDGPLVEKNEVLVEEKGLLLVKTEPAGCDIFVDGVAAGQTPKLFTELATRETYQLKLVKTGYQDREIVVKFNGRTPQVREERMLLDSGTIRITSDPVGATVTVNGIERGMTPVEVTGVPRGRATVKFALAGYADEVRELAVNAGDVQNLPIVLTALPGTLHLVSVPEGARFYLNEEARGQGPLTIPSLKPGEYTVRVEMDGYATETRTLRIENGASAREEFQLSNVMGRLEVRSSPAGAEVIFDGRPVGLTKTQDESAEFSDMLAIENLKEGEHTLVLRREGYSEAVRHPVIRRSKTAKANVRLKRIFKPDVEIVTARGSYRGVLVSRTPESVVVEVSLGITRSFPVDEVRKVNFLLETEKP